MKKLKLFLALLSIAGSSALVVYAVCDDKVKTNGADRAATNTSCAAVGVPAVYPGDTKACSYDLYDTPWDSCDGTTGQDPKSNAVCSEAATSNHPTHTLNGTCNGQGGCHNGVWPGVVGPTNPGKVGTLTSC
jgi:hypothetical protein